jgi:succinyl-CoA synthetase beta subunit
MTPETKQMGKRGEVKPHSSDIIGPAIRIGQKALSEYDAKRFLSGHGIPVAEMRLCRTPEKAAESAAAIGWPVVVKACSPDLLHKSEHGAVHLNLASGEAVKQACRQLAAGGHTDIDGYLVEAMLCGRRELVAGMTRDPQFGPCVMLGAGGVFTEVLDDTVFRVAPFERSEALEMITELRSGKMLGDFRGEAAVDRHMLAGILLALGEIGTTCDNVAEIDINPLIVHPDGNLTAADALVVLGG